MYVTESRKTSLMVSETCIVEEMETNTGIAYTILFDFLSIFSSIKQDLLTNTDT